MVAPNDDIVAELDEMLYGFSEHSLEAETIKRARDEIVALRKGYDYLRRVFEICAPECTPLPDLLGLCTQIDNLIAGYRDVGNWIRDKAHDEALEEAALACEALGVGPYQRSAAAIRALKSKT